MVQTRLVTQIGPSEFNSNYNDNMYVGYMYTNGQVHGRIETSTIKGVLDSWYNNNLSDYSEYIATGNGATFCNDRTPYSGSGTNTTVTLYAAANRLSTNKSPSLKCTNSSDRFNINVGLITADEVSHGGGVLGTHNSNYYFYTSHVYWTMSPDSASSNAKVFLVNNYGSLDSYYVNATWVAVRPVINLKADTTFSSGIGTIDNPYIVS